MLMYLRVRTSCTNVTSGKSYCTWQKVWVTCSDVCLRAFFSDVSACEWMVCLLFGLSGHVFWMTYCIMCCFVCVYSGRSLSWWNWNSWTWAAMNWKFWWVNSSSHPLLLYNIIYSRQFYCQALKQRLQLCVQITYFAAHAQWHVP